MAALHVPPAGSTKVVTTPQLPTTLTAMPVAHVHLQREGTGTLCRDSMQRLEALFAAGASMCHNRTEYTGVCVQVFDCHMDANQRWYIDTLARIHSTAFPDKCIDVSAGKGVAVTCSAALTQRFDQLGELFPAVAGSGAAV